MTPIATSIPLTLKLTFFENVRDNLPKERPREWPAFVAQIAEPTVRVGKDGWLFSPATFNQPRRLQANVTELSALVLDVDHRATLDEAISPFAAAGLMLAAYTTHSHRRVTESNPEAEDRFRIVIPYATPAPPEGHRAAWQWALAALGGRLDAQTKNLDRIYYLPAKASADAPYEYRVIEGAPLDWRSLPSVEAVSPLDDERQLTVSAPTESRDAYARAALNAEVAKVLGAPKGSRNDTLNKAAFALGSLVGAGVLDYSQAESALINAADMIGPDKSKNRSTVKRGLADGMKDPRDIPQSSKPQPPRQSTQEEKDDPWENPAAFSSYRVPPFPIETFPRWLRDFVSELAHETQTPVEMGAMAAFGVLAAVIAPEVKINVRGNWHENLNLYTLTALPPAHRKSAVHDAITKPLADYEDRIRGELRKTVEQEKAERRTLRNRMERAEKDAARLEGGELQAKQAEIREMAAQLAEWNEPVLPQLIADDVTPETLATLLDQQGGCIAVFSSEGGIFDQMAGRYSDGTPNLDVFLKGHNGDMLRINRRERLETVRNPRLTMTLAVQPDVLKAAALKPGFRGRGLLGRFLYVLPPSRLGSREIAPFPMMEPTRQRYEANVLKLKESPMMSLIRLSPEADDLLQEFEREVEAELADGGMLSDIPDWGGKLVGHVCRLAGLLHLAEHVDALAKWPEMVRPEMVGRAIRIGRCLSAHATAIFDEMKKRQQISDSEKVLGWVKKQKRTEFTPREAFHDLRRHFKTVSDLHPALTLLEEHGYVRSIENKFSRKKRVYEICPVDEVLTTVDEVLTGRRQQINQVESEITKSVDVLTPEQGGNSLDEVTEVEKPGSTENVNTSTLCVIQSEDRDLPVDGGASTDRQQLSTDGRCRECGSELSEGGGCPVCAEVIPF